MTRPRSLSESPSFETALAEIEAIVGRLESGQLTLDESLSAYRRGAALLKVCQSQIADAERQLLLLDENSLKPFSPSGQGGDDRE